MDIFYNNLPNYLKKYLISILVDRDYKIKLTLDYYNSTGEYKNINDDGKLKGFLEFNQSNILSYSLVSKEWFYSVQLSLNIIDSLFVFNDDGGGNCNSEYSLIKLNNIESFIQRGIEENSNEIYKTEKEILDRFINLKEILHVLPFDIIDNTKEIRIKDLDFLNSNFTINLSRIRLTVFKTYEDHIHNSVYLEKLIKSSKETKLLNNNYKGGSGSGSGGGGDSIKVVDTLKFTYLPEIELFKEMVSIFKPKRLIIDDETDGWYYHFDFNGLFNIIPTPSLEYITIKNQFIDPYALIGCDQFTPNLKSVSVLFHFHELLFNMQRLYFQSKPAPTTTETENQQFIKHFKSVKNYINGFKNINHSDDEDFNEDQKLANYKQRLKLNDDQILNEILSNYSRYDNDEIYKYHRGLCIDTYSKVSCCSIARTKHTLKDWSEFCHSISNCNQLTSLKLSEICDYNLNNYFIVNGILPNYFIDPLISLIKNTTSINHLSLTKMSYLIDQRVISSLKFNKSIVSLNLSKSISNSTILSFLFFEILSNNIPNIKYLKLLNLPKDCESLVLDFQNNSNQLYSFTFSFTDQ